jgi:hypothetical protein
VSERVVILGNVDKLFTFNPNNVFQGKKYTNFLPSTQTADSKGKNIQLYSCAVEITPVNQLQVNKNTILPNKA